MQTTETRARLWTKNFILISVMGLFTSLVMRLLDNTLAIYANDVWGSKSGGGMLTTAFTFGSIVATALCGNVIDRTGRRRALVFGAVVFIIATAGLLLFTEPWIVYSLRALEGFGKAIAGVAAASMAADIIPRERMGEGMGYYGLGQTLSSAFGPALGILLISSGDYNVMFGSCILLYVFVLIMCGFIDYEKNAKRAAAQLEAMRESARSSEAEPAEQPEESELLRAVSGQGGEARRGIWKLFEKASLPSAVVQFFASGGGACILVYLTLYAQDELGYENPGMFFTISAVTMLLTRLFVGKLVDRRGVFAVLLMGAGLSIANYALLAFAAKESYLVFLLSGAIYGVSSSMIYPALNASVIVDSPADRKGVANSTLMFGMDFGILIASALFGVVLEGIGWIPMYGAGVMFYIVAIVLTAALMTNGSRKKRRLKYGIPEPVSE